MKTLLLELLMDLMGSLITDDMITKAKKKAVGWLRGQVRNTANEIDDKMVEIIAKALCVE